MKKVQEVRGFGTQSGFKKRENPESKKQIPSPYYSYSKNESSLTFRGFE